MLLVEPISRMITVNRDDKNWEKDLYGSNQIVEGVDATAVSRLTAELVV